MIRGLILFYLNIKSTHGYEIQRFIQLSGMDQWAKIQSGSIYYALAKLEKEQNVVVLSEEQVGLRVRKVYQITDKGRKTLKQEMRKELAAPITECGSTKMIIDPMLGVLDREEMVTILNKHILTLQESLEYWKKWKTIKAGNGATKLSSISFDMSIHSLEDQICWHQELLDHLDLYVEQSKQVKHVIQAFEPETSDNVRQENETQKKIAFIENVKNTLQDDPGKALETLNKMLEEMKKEP